MCGVWLDIQTVYSSVPGLYQPMSPRGLHRVRDQPLVDDPLADHDLGGVDGGVGAGLVADGPLEHDVVRARSRGAAARRRRWPSRRRRRPAAAPSRPRSPRARRTPAPAVSATTAATPSPVHLTLSMARIRGVFTLFWMPALPPAGQAIGSGLYGMSAPMKTATTPGIALAAVGVDASGCWRGRTGCAGWPRGSSTGA